MIDLLLEILEQTNKNEITKYCVKNFNDWNKIASCQSDLLTVKKDLKEKELREFLRKNPHYRYPGVALPAGAQKSLHPCWGKDRKYHTDRGC